MSEHRTKIVEQQAERFKAGRVNEGDDANTRAAKAEVQRSASRVIRHIAALDERDEPGRMGGR